MKRADVFEFFRRLAEANPSPATELDFTNPYTLLVAVVLSAQATDAGVNLATRPLFARIENSRTDDRPWRRCIARGDQEHRTVQHQGSKRDCAQQSPSGVVRIQGPSRTRTIAAASGGGTKNSQCRPQHRIWRRNLRGRYPRLQDLQPHWTCARKNTGRGRSQTRKSRPAAVPPRRAPLANPSWTLHLQSAPSRMLALSGARSVQL